MAITLPGIASDVEQMIGEFRAFSGSNEINLPVITVEVERNISTISRDIPQEISVQITGTGSKYYPLEGGSKILASYEEGFSEIKQIFWDTDTMVADNDLPNELDFDDLQWRTVRIPTGLQLLFIGLTPTTSDKFDVLYTARHTISNDSSTLPDIYKNALIYLTVATISHWASLKAEQAIDPPAGANFVSMNSKGRGYNNIAELFMKKYEKEIGLDDTVRPSGVWRDLDVRFQTNDAYIFHSLETR